MQSREIGELRKSDFCLRNFVKEQKNFFTRRRCEEAVFPDLLKKKVEGSLGNGENQV
jgi:hypothetical protein